jgi:thiopeptide-type bacteriocin biosynthesis protein
MKFHSNFVFRSPFYGTSQKFQEFEFLESLYLASPAFYEEFYKHLNNPILDNKDLKKINNSFYKYQRRASNRCTPFGLFAGISVGDWSDESNIILDSNLKKTLSRKTRLDMNVLFSIVQELTKQSFIKPHLKYYPNTSVYLIGNSYRYIEYYYIDNRRFHRLNKVDYTSYLRNILSECRNGLNQHDLISLLINDEIDFDEANDFISELIASQLLINELEPTITGDDYFTVLLKNLENIYIKHSSVELRDLLELLISIDELIKINDSEVFNSIESYKYIYQKIKVILPELNETNLFQIDLYKVPNVAKLDISIQVQLQNAISFLNKISPPDLNVNLEKFKNRFRDYYEDNEVSLLLALDTETGIGYPEKDKNGINDLIDTIYTIKVDNGNEIKWDSLQVHLLKLITSSIKQNKKVIEISELDFKNIDYSDSILPYSYSIMFKMLNIASNKINVSSIGYSSAINLLGRFAGGDEKLHNIIKEIAIFEQEQIPDKILAEIVHLPESRTGNILARPNFRAYEIPYLAKSSVDNEFQIKMEDLVLKLVDDKIILFDKRLKKEIIPRLGNAHNYINNSLPLYHFLGDLQTQYFTKTSLSFHWGVLANQFSFLPRVEYQNSVLSPAKWQLRKHDLEPFQNKTITSIEKYDLFFNLKERIELPVRFLIADYDNELLITSDDLIAIDTFIDAVKNRNEITLIECLFEEDFALIKDTNGNSFANECIAIVLNETTDKERSKVIEAKNFTSQQTFGIGSEWLYYKIYCGAKTADYILSEKIKHISEKLLSEEIIDKWFFIRYADPEIHLRIRLHITNLKKYGEILELINTELGPLVNQHVISKIQTDTYKRELDRYGDNSIELVEQLFYNDSIFVTDMLEMIDADYGGTIRWQMAIRSVDEFLNDFKLTLEEKYNLIEMLSVSFFKEHGGKQELKTVLNNKFRTLRNQLEDVLDLNNEVEKEYYPILELIQVRSQSNRIIVEDILMLRSSNQLMVRFSELLSSLLHMNLDRLFMGRNRTNEFVVYDLLTRQYKSTMARLKFDSKIKL